MSGRTGLRTNLKNQDAPPPHPASRPNPSKAQIAPSCRSVPLPRSALPTAGTTCPPPSLPSLTSGRTGIHAPPPPEIKDAPPTHPSPRPSPARAAPRSSTPPTPPSPPCRRLQHHGETVKTIKSVVGAWRATLPAVTIVTACHTAKSIAKILKPRPHSMRIKAQPTARRASTKLVPPIVE